MIRGPLQTQIIFTNQSPCHEIRGTHWFHYGIDPSTFRRLLLARVYAMKKAAFCSRGRTGSTLAAAMEMVIWERNHLLSKETITVTAGACGGEAAAGSLGVQGRYLMAGKPARTPQCSYVLLRYRWMKARFSTLMGISFKMVPSNERCLKRTRIYPPLFTM